MILEAPERRWVCPSCTATDTTRETKPHTRMHPCAGMAGLTVPMVPEGTRAHHQAHDREDYINGEIVATDNNGRPVMSVTTTRDDGQDCTVYAPTATANIATREKS